MNAAELLAQADVTAALAELTGEVRAKPGDFRLRVFLAQLLCVCGQWERALNQLNTAAELDASAIPMKQIYSDAIGCEAVRAGVFAGQRTPLIFGEPEPWLAMLVESLLQAGQSNDAMAEDLRQRAFEQAPASAGHCDDQSFEWLADADMRLGPVLEAYINGRYAWIPFARLGRIRIEAPEDLRDVVWLPTHLDFINGGETLALIPTRYEGSHLVEDGNIQLARKTEWREIRPEVWAGLGQRMFSSDTGDRALMDIREIVFNPLA